ncbi:MAG: thiamine-phosphate kinase, partial [Actinomycetota bacterium]
MSIQTLETLGEIESLRRTISHLKKSENVLIGPGDDAAMLQSGGRYLVSTDTLIENHDFKTSWSTGFDIGFKS